MNSKNFGRQMSRNVVYILPNLFTTASLMTGFGSILLALDGRFTFASILIFVSMVLDGLDGRVARWTNTQSKFGEQYDSLADVIAFGVAPSILVYLWAFKGLEGVSKTIGIGWFASFIFLACAALRLARFNVQIGHVDKRFFVGLASPAAAAIVAGGVWAGSRLGIDGHSVSYLMVVLTIYAGLMMVSNFLFYSFKTIEIKRVRFPFLVVVVIYAALLVAIPSVILFITAMIYGLSAPIHWITRRILRKKRLKELKQKRHSNNG